MPPPNRSLKRGVATWSCSTRSTFTPGWVSAKPTCCNRWPGRAMPNARSFISPPRNSCTASWRRCGRRRRWRSRKRCEPSTSWSSTTCNSFKADREVRDLIRPQEPKRVKIEDIQRVVARQYNVSRSDLLSSRRTANVVRPRQVAMYLAKTLTLRSLPEIGRRFGGRDHTTVLHAVRKIENLVNTDSALAEEIELLKRQLQE